MNGRVSSDCVPIVRSYVDMETHEQTLSLAELVLRRGKATLNHDYKGSGEDIASGMTMFSEITVSHPVLPESLQALNVAKTDAAFDVAAIAEGLSRVIERTWDSSKYHLMVCSAGYDSRIVSQTIANLQDKNGRNWLGKILFLCWEPEGTAFKKIMALQGWKNDEYYVCNEGAETNEYYAGVLDFKHAWKWPNDAQPPIYIHGLTIERLRASGRIPPIDMQYIGAGGGNECFDLFPEEMMKMFFYSRWGGFLSAISPAEVIMPWMSHEVLKHITPQTRYIRSRAKFKIELDRVLFQVKFENPTAAVRVRSKLIKYLSPELLKIERNDDDSSAPQRQLSESLMAKCRQDFTDSWYFCNVIKPRDSNFDNNVPKTLWTDPWWGEYAKASLCRHLIHQGVQIK